MITIFCEKIVKTAISLRAWCKVVQDLYQAAETGLQMVHILRVYQLKISLSLSILSLHASSCGVNLCGFHTTTKLG